VLDFTVAAARVHAEIYADLAKKGQMIGAHDLIIAATARCHDLSVLTDNVQEFSPCAWLARASVRLLRTSCGANPIHRDLASARQSISPLPRSKSGIISPASRHALRGENAMLFLGQSRQRTCQGVSRCGPNTANQSNHHSASGYCSGASPCFAITRGFFMRGLGGSIFSSLTLKFQQSP
jgi:hypothetical protein